ncbi:MAG: hypothetical protein U0L70_00705 [Ruminococcus sp.]|nr:hypothetical protein [Ruminococcus sp.]
MANQNTGNNMMQTNSIIPNEAFNTTLNQGLNPGDYYGFPSGSCTQQGCVPNVVNQERYMIPSVEQIAAYHNQQIGRTGASSPTTPSDTTEQQGMQENISSNQNAVPSTPATTFDYGATIQQPLESSLMDGITDTQHPYPVTAESLQYLNGFLRTQIGRRVSIDFLVGSNSIVTKSGFLLGVASNYILINELDTNDLTTCDFYNIKFIRFYY